MYPELHTWDCRLAQWTFSTAAAAHELHAEGCVEAFQHLRVHALRLNLTEIGHFVSLSAYTAVIHLFGGEHCSDVSQPVTSCNTPSPFHQAAHASKSGAVSFV